MVCIGVMMMFNEGFGKCNELCMGGVGSWMFVSVMLHVFDGYGMNKCDMPKETGKVLIRTCSVVKHLITRTFSQTTASGALSHSSGSFLSAPRACSLST